MDHLAVQPSTEFDEAGQIVYVRVPGEQAFKLWSGKHKTTGFKGQAITNLRGDLLFVSDPVTGNHHDMTALAD
ncbi:MAG: hypothetical protein ACXVAT_17390, partial [Isosphaeraceae bacterium]